ncbi:MAG: pyruvate ferredoxin oxidoreductase subunit gamma [Candidatus Aenigmatarchaeota archaeon]
MKQIRIHGRGGQGSVTMASMMAEAAFESGKEAQGFPSFGVERLGAPIEAYVRIDNKEITDRSQIYNPDFVIVQDSTLIELVEVEKGLKDDGMILINTSEDAENIDLDTEAEIVTVDATEIALEHLGKPIMNTALAGAFAKATGLIEEESMAKVIRETFEGEIGQKNVKAMEEAYGVVQ